jgi:hypothetical protein
MECSPCGYLCNPHNFTKKHQPETTVASDMVAARIVNVVFFAWLTGSSSPVQIVPSLPYSAIGPKIGPNRKLPSFR